MLTLLATTHTSVSRSAHVFSVTGYLTDSLSGGDVVSVTVVLNGPVTPMLVTAAT